MAPRRSGRAKLTHARGSIRKKVADGHLFSCIDWLGRDHDRARASALIRRATCSPTALAGLANTGAAVRPHHARRAAGAAGRATNLTSWAAGRAVGVVAAPTSVGATAVSLEAERVTAHTRFFRGIAATRRSCSRRRVERIACTGEALEGRGIVVERAGFGERTELHAISTRIGGCARWLLGVHDDAWQRDEREREDVRVPPRISHGSEHATPPQGLGPAGRRRFYRS